MATLVPAIAKVIAATPANGPAGTIRYDLLVTKASGEVLPVNGVRSHSVPDESQQPDPVHVRAAAVGTTWPAAFVDIHLQAFIVEERDFGPCDEAAGAAGADVPPDAEQDRPSGGLLATVGRLLGMGNT